MQRAAGELREPRPDRRVVPQPAKLFVHLGEDVLEHILGVVDRQSKALHADGVDVAREALDERIPRRSVPVAAALDELRIRQPADVSSTVDLRDVRSYAALQEPVPSHAKDANREIDRRRMLPRVAESRRRPVRLPRRGRRATGCCSTAGRACCRGFGWRSRGRSSTGSCSAICISTIRGDLWGWAVGPARRARPRPRGAGAVAAARYPQRVRALRAGRCVCPGVQAPRVRRA